MKVVELRDGIGLGPQADFARLRNGIVSHVELPVIYRTHNYFTAHGDFYRALFTGFFPEPTGFHELMNPTFLISASDGPSTGLPVANGQNLSDREPRDNGFPSSFR